MQVLRHILMHNRRLSARKLNKISTSFNTQDVHRASQTVGQQAHIPMSVGVSGCMWMRLWIRIRIRIRLRIRRWMRMLPYSSIDTQLKWVVGSILRVLRLLVWLRFTQLKQIVNGNCCRWQATRIFGLAPRSRHRSPAIILFNIMLCLLLLYRT